jgi:hypothetical protein
VVLDPDPKSVRTGPITIPGPCQSPDADHAQRRQCQRSLAFVRSHYRLHSFTQRLLDVIRVFVATWRRSGLQHPLLPREAGQHSAGWRCGRRCGNGHRLLWVNDPASICKPSSCRRSPRWCQGHPGFRLRDRIRQSAAPLSGRIPFACMCSRRRSGPGSLWGNHGFRRFLQLGRASKACNRQLCEGLPHPATTSGERPSGKSRGMWLLPSSGRHTDN